MAQDTVDFVISNMYNVYSVHCTVYNRFTQCVRISLYLLFKRSDLIHFHYTKCIMYINRYYEDTCILFVDNMLSILNNIFINSKSFLFYIMQMYLQSRIHRYYVLQYTPEDWITLTILCTHSY